MKMVQREVDLMKQKQIVNFYMSEIYFFERKSTELLLQLILHESKIEKVMQQKLRVSEEDMDQLLELIKLGLKAIAIVDTYEHFLLLQIPPSKENNEMFFARRDLHFENLLAIFLLKVKSEQSIDFTIRQ